MNDKDISTEQPATRFLNGSRLWGDDFSSDELEAWYSDEELGYYTVSTEYYGKSYDGEEDSYEYTALNNIHAFNLVRTRRFGLCAAIGCADGQDVAEIASAVDRFVAIEPVKAWWRDSIGGRPATFIKPNASGDISLADDSVDLFVSMGVLHHIPNVSHVLGEAGRILKRGGWLVLREPVSSMGSWWQPRAGLTKRERGLPPRWLIATLEAKGFKIVRKRHCLTTPMIAAAKTLGIRRPFMNKVYVLFDWFASSLLSPNARYYRPRLIDKFAPGSIFILAEKK